MSRESCRTRTLCLVCDMRQSSVFFLDQTYYTLACYEGKGLGTSILSRCRERAVASSSVRPRRSPLLTISFYFPRCTETACRRPNADGRSCLVDRWEQMESGGKPGADMQLPKRLGRQLPGPARLSKGSFRANRVKCTQQHHASKMCLHSYTFPRTRPQSSQQGRFVVVT